MLLNKHRPRELIWSLRVEAPLFLLLQLKVQHLWGAIVTRFTFLEEEEDTSVGTGEAERQVFEDRRLKGWHRRPPT